ncbi:hypothetical protein [Pedobacter punctiformis]|uniref:Uncharacterized protein n=1 Tax=Pedobacter punctiformis TaxID=3004097 RepID=A0ABT4LBY5_9SPHI|nr:hypothetical protein [Pedobacter sp. HCMS5-2]MCZ4245437.1 hypothetical protein [Pedobacter sp. HCMS5-2]
MKVEETINKVLNIPKELSRNDNISVYNALKNSGYFLNFGEVTEESIKNILSQKDKQIIDNWLTYSENKRTTSGWYFFF